jgi:hypothetical protein
MYSMTSEELVITLVLERQRNNRAKVVLVKDLFFLNTSTLRKSS